MKIRVSGKQPQRLHGKDVQVAIYDVEGLAALPPGSAASIQCDINGRWGMALLTVTTLDGQKYTLPITSLEIEAG